jgi:hypothetical protein
VLGFRPADKKQYGVLELDGDGVTRIVEWKYWKTYPKERRDNLTICNSGIYSARTRDFLPYLARLERSPHTVHKEREGKVIELQEFFITDLVEFMRGDGLKVGYVVAENEDEIMGVDDLPSLKEAQRLFQASAFHSPLKSLEGAWGHLGVFLPMLAPPPGFFLDRDAFASIFRWSFWSYGATTFLQPFFSHPRDARRGPGENRNGVFIKESLGERIWYKYWPHRSPSVSTTRIAPSQSFSKTATKHGSKPAIIFLDAK